MKKTALSILPLALLGVAGAVHAQSSVTLYGLIDESAQYVHNNGNGQNSLGLVAGNIAGDRWGLKGTEALGGDLSAIFQLENGFNINSGALGQGGRMFGRQAYVGLQSNTYGTLTLGRQYDPLVDLVQPLTGDDPGGSAFTTPGDVDNNDNSSRTNNAAKYTSPTFWNGFQVETMYGFGNNAGSVGSGQNWAGAIAYNHSLFGGQFSAAAGYFYAANSGLPGETWVGSSDGNFDGSASTPTDNYVNGPFITARSLGIASVAAQYVFGSASQYRVSLRYSNVEYQPSADLTASFNATQIYNVAGVLAEYHISPAWHVDAGYIFTHGSGSGADQTYHQLSLGTDYWLSKRTDLYLLGTWQHASGNYGDGSPNFASAGDYGYGSSSDHQEIVSLGIRHRF